MIKLQIFASKIAINFDDYFANRKNRCHLEIAIFFFFNKYKSGKGNRLFDTYTTSLYSSSLLRNEMITKEFYYLYFDYLD